MVAPVRTNRVAFRRAVIASVALHVVLAVGVVIVVRSGGGPKKPTTPGIDTRADVVIRTFLDEPAVTTQAADIPPFSPSPPSPEPAAAPVEVTESLRPPLANPIAQPLSPELIAIVRRQVAPPQPVADHNVKPAGATSVPAIHGALTPGKTVVYVLDCSGSMGEFGKLAVARAALAATLRGQPEGVRFQVIAYNSTARVLMSGGAQPATTANVEAAEAKVLALESAGRSNHAEAVRVAVGLRPDVILLLTDAEELSLAQFRPALAPVGKAIPICVAKVTATGVQAHQELR